MTIPQAAQALAVTYHSARRNVEQLAEAGILRQLGESKYGKLYVADAILGVLNET